MFYTIVNSLGNKKVSRWQILLVFYIFNYAVDILGLWVAGFCAFKMFGFTCKHDSIYSNQIKVFTGV